MKTKTPDHRTSELRLPIGAPNTLYVLDGGGWMPFAIASAKVKDGEVVLELKGSKELRVLESGQEANK